MQGFLSRRESFCDLGERSRVSRESYVFPRRREHSYISRLGIAVVDENDDPPVVLSPDNPSRRLKHAVHARVGVGVIEPASRLLLLIVFGKDIALVRERRYPRADDDAPDKATAGKVTPSEKLPPSTQNPTRSTPRSALKEDRKSSLSRRLIPRVWTTVFTFGYLLLNTSSVFSRKSYDGK